MSQQQSKFDKAMALIDAANSDDPNRAEIDGKDWPKELLYSRFMTEMLGRFMPDADAAQRLAIRAQHIQRWKSPRNAYPTGRIGYLQWRKDLYKMQAQTAVDLLVQAGYGDEDTGRVYNAIAKLQIKANPDTQLLEDIASLVFLEHYLQEFADKHPEYDEEKWLGIIRKTWKKMSQRAQQFALSGEVNLPDALLPLIRKAVS